MKKLTKFATLAILAALAATWLMRQFIDHGRVAFIAAAIVFATGFVHPIVEMARLHPYEYTYYNSFIGGISGARARFMLDYWGLSFKQAGNALRDLLEARHERPPQGQWTIAVCGPHPPAYVALGPEFHLTWDPKGADFALMLGEFYCAQFDAPVLVEITREGVVYARVYDIRGRSVPGIFTQPPVQ